MFSLARAERQSKAPGSLNVKVSQVSLMNIGHDSSAHLDFAVYVCGLDFCLSVSVLVNRVAAACVWYHVGETALLVLSCSFAGIFRG